MKRTTTLLFIILMLIPVVWNGIGLVHYLVEHTHAFCINDEGHKHQPFHDCQNIWGYQYEHPQEGIPISLSVEFQEIKNYLSSALIYVAPTHSPDPARVFFDPDFCCQDFTQEIFHPPTC